MSIIDKKRKVFGKIAAARTLTDGMPSFKQSSSISSINNNGNTIAFLSDLIRSLVGYEMLVESVVDMLSFSLPNIETSIKNVLKMELKSIVNCGIDPHLPSWIQSSGTGIIIEVNKIDFNDILKINPTSVAGNLIYSDITPTFVDSSDFNTFLYGVIQNDGVTYSWNNIYDVTFNSISAGNPNNTLTIKANPIYDVKTLTDLNNDYIDSLSLFNTENIVSQIMDIIYGSVSSSINKSLKQLENEAKINNVIDKISNNVNKNTLSDDAFSFTKEENYNHEIEASNRKKGVKILNVSDQINASVPIASLTSFNTEMLSAINSTQQKTAIINALNNMSQDNIKNVTNPTDNTTVKLNFIQEIINNLGKAIINKVLSPKVILCFLMNYKIIYGQDSEYSNAIDFIKKNNNLINNIVKKITTDIINRLLGIALKVIQDLVAKTILKKTKEKNTLRVNQILSLTGVPSSQLKNLTDII